MILLNFGHPLSAEQVHEIEQKTGVSSIEMWAFPVQFNHELSFVDQVRAIVDGVGFSSDEWQTRPLLINPPSHNLIAVILMAELHGRMGHFPAVVRLRPKEGSVPVQFELAEIIDLQSVRDKSRYRRTQS